MGELGHRNTRFSSGGQALPRQSMVHRQFEGWRLERRAGCRPWIHRGNSPDRQRQRTRFDNRIEANTLLFPHDPNRWVQPISWSWYNPRIRLLELVQSRGAEARLGTPSRFLPAAPNRSHWWNCGKTDEFSGAGLPKAGVTNLKRVSRILPRRISARIGGTFGSLKPTAISRGRVPCGLSMTAYLWYLLAPKGTIDLLQARKLNLSVEVRGEPAGTRSSGACL